MSAGPIAVLSGKGGAGKTTVASRLAQAAALETKVRFADADAEEPNAALMLRPATGEAVPVESQVAVVDPDLCNGCGECVERCAFQALSLVGGKARASESLCHGCDLCRRICTRHAIAMLPRRIGTLLGGKADTLKRGKTVEGIEFLEGRLDVGQPRATEIVKAVMDALPRQDETIVDGPPGCACTAMLVARRSAFCLLVAQPTPMGVHDLELVLEMTERLEHPRAIVINRSHPRGDALVEEVARRRWVPILGRIPEDPAIADAGLDLAATGHAELFRALWNSLKEVRA